MKKVILDQAKIAYLRSGKVGKPKILMLHGILSNSTYFKKSIKFLEDNFDILALDFPGFGHSDKLKLLPHNVDTYVDTLKKLCDHLDFKPFDLIAHSFGGIVGVVFTTKYTSYVKKIVLQAVPYDKTCINRGFIEKTLLYASKNKGIVKVAAFLKKAVSRKILMSFFRLFNKHYHEIEQKDGKIVFSFQTMDLEATGDIWQNVCNSDLKEYLGKIKNETLVISGDHDVQVFPEKVEELTKMIQGAKFRSVKGWDCTHALFLDHPKKMAGIVREFLIHQ
ncbi:alpha/beta fold hydrolase [Patescibacteria group bacterium]